MYKYNLYTYEQSGIRFEKTQGRSVSFFAFRGRFSTISYKNVLVYSSLEKRNCLLETGRNVRQRSTGSSTDL